MARIAMAVTGLGAAVLMTACGGGDGFADKPADEIVKASKADMGDLKAVKVSGSVTSDGQQIDIDLQASSGGDCTGTIGIAGGSTELLGVDGSTWMKPDEAFWRATAGETADQVIATVGDKWVVIPAEDDSFNSFCDVDELLDQMLKDDKTDGSKYTVKGTEDVDGDETVAVDNEDPEDGTSTGYVLVDDPHYLVKIEKTDGKDTGSVTFSEFDEEFEVEAPGDDEVIDFAQLGA
ncbi:hypothetical protein [Nocardioides sp. T2.26MG-1]|uniref:hypothetical protein n=1 Tax=Nocardioides sp. T2.26MG-1 TaxID=3041166 RepID=UPI0024777B96|nr:hypothetical protein [Nocardioides sp. T2.26MG-1]CAI9401596.1 hypothetical protein HIDPHFAB_00640 [Nocardioides sp. T2.26MG-1]